MTVISSLGFQRTRQDQRLADLVAAFQGIYGTGVDLGEDTLDGQWLNVIAEAFADTDQLAEQVYQSFNPAAALDAGLDRLCALTGITRQKNATSTVALTLTGDGGTTVLAGSLVARSDDPTVIFQTSANATLVGGVGTGVVTGVQATCTTVGPVLAPAGLLTVPKTIVAGWTGVTNPLDATPGSLRELNPVLRLRRAGSVARAGQAITDAVYAAVSNVVNVTSAVVYENQLDVVNAQGLPPHSMNVIVAGGDPLAIGTAIFLTRTIGATLVGAQQVNVLDAQGFNQIVKFDRPTQAPIYVTVHLTAEPGSAVRNAIIDALAAAGAAAAKIGAPVLWSSLFPPILAALGTVPNGPVVTAVNVGLAPGPTLQANVALPTTSIATWDNRHDNTGNILVVTP